VEKQDEDGNWMEVKTKRNKRSNRPSVGIGPSKQSPVEHLDFQFDSEIQIPHPNHSQPTENMSV
jgi:hypothetical protein